MLPSTASRFSTLRRCLNSIAGDSIGCPPVPETSTFRAPPKKLGAATAAALVR
jgi:hypothetical protein